MRAIDKMLNINSFVELCVNYAKTNGIELTHLKLQKIIYYIQAWSLAYADDELFEDEPQAWVNGPVYRQVYNRFRDRKDEPIVRGGAICEQDAQELKGTLQCLELGQEKEELLVAILEEFAPKSAGELVYRTHSERPWKDARVGLGPFETGTNVITHQAMQDYYKGLIAKNEPVKA